MFINLRLIKVYIKRLFEKFNSQYIDNIKRDILRDDEFIAIDIGAAVGVQSWWYEVLRFGTIFAFEPNKNSAKKLKEMYKDYNYNVIEDALDIEDSERTIYLTNVPTGSSLLKPNKNYKYADPSYFFPLTEEIIITNKTENSFKRNDINDIDLMKIDTQGTELNILKGLGKEYLGKLLAVEFEAGLPGGYEKQSSFLEVHSFMNENNFELFDLRSARVNLFYKTTIPYEKKRKVSKKIHEVDVLYFKNLSYVLDKKESSKLRKLIMSYCTYSFFDEALFAVNEGLIHNIFSKKESKTLFKSVKHWHDAKYIYFGHYLWFNYSE